MRRLTRQAQQLLDTVGAVLPRLGRDVDEVEEAHPHLGRNISGRLTFADGEQVFVKRISGLGAAERYARSVSFHDAVDHPTLPDTSTPRLLARDEEALILAFEVVEGEKGIGAQIRDDELDDAGLVRLGRCVAGLHSLPVRDATVTDTSHPFFPPHGPNAITAQMYYGSTMGQLEMWRLIQGDQSLREACDELVHADAPKVPVHGDFRGDQVLFAGDTMWILDWEDFRLEDGARDVGALMGDVFYHRMRTFMGSFAGGLPAAIDERAIVARGAEALEAAAPRARMVWDAYRTARGDLDPGFVHRSIQFFGWHLFDRGLAAGTYYGRLSAVDRALAGIGREAILGGEAYAGALGMAIEELAA